MRFADRCEVGRLMFVHHGPGRTDDELDRLSDAVTTTPQGRPVSFGRQGQTVALAAPVTT